VRSREEEGMNTRAVAALLAGSACLAFGGVACGQNYPSTTEATLGYSLAWQDTGNGNGILEPGESAVLRLTVSMTPAVDTVIRFTGGQGGPTGTLRGIASGFIDLTGTGRTQGPFNLDPLAGYGVQHSWDTVNSFPGFPNGTGLWNIQFAQFPTGSSSVNTTNPVVNVWSAAWTPSSYSARTVTFGTAPASASGGEASAVIIKWGPLNANIQVATCLSEFGNINIPIVPAPAGLALLGLGGVVASARARRES
jgi:hypothetical protein